MNGHAVMHDEGHHAAACGHSGQIQSILCLRQNWQFSNCEHLAGACYILLGGRLRLCAPKSEAKGHLYCGNSFCLTVNMTFMTQLLCVENSLSKTHHTEMQQVRCAELSVKRLREGHCGIKHNNKTHLLHRESFINQRHCISTICSTTCHA
jgi:hypothetical protein